MTSPSNSASPSVGGGRFGRYVTTRLLGAGGMGAVYEARHPILGKRVAIKSIKTAHLGDPVSETRFLREAQAAARISHPHVVDIFDIGVDDGRPFIVMEFLEGETLDAALARARRFEVGPLVDLFLPVISAVAAIHDAGVVHRDLKPSNVMLARRGRATIEPVVLDFSISRSLPDDAVGEQPRLTDPQLLVGTLPYLSPEQIRDARAAGPASDQYALGVMLYECLTGLRPFGGNDAYEQMHAAMTATVAAPSTLIGIPRGLDQVLLRAMNRRPEGRYPGVRALGAELLSFASPLTCKRWAPELTGLGPRDGELSMNDTATDTRRPKRRPRFPAGSRRRAAALTAGATLLLTATAAVWRPLSPTAAPKTSAAHTAVAPAAREPETPSSREPGPSPDPGPAAETTEALPPETAPPVRVPTLPALVAPPAGRARARAALEPRAPSDSSSRRRRVAATPPAGAGRSTNPGKPAEEAEDDEVIDPFAPIR
jgi:eukaryotic-like serine/threonine-protein kinase